MLKIKKKLLNKKIKQKKNHKRKSFKIILQPKNVKTKKKSS